MSWHRNDDRILPQYFPSLFHLANVKVVFPLFHTFLIEDAAADNKIVSESRLGSRRKRVLSLLRNFPKHLRRKIYEPFKGLRNEISCWRITHSTILKLENQECLRVIQWRSDGTIDAVRTAQQIVLDKSIDIGKRFEVACMYCLETSVRALWTEMEESGQTEDFVAVEHSTATFWIRWIQDVSEVHWKQGISKYLRRRPSLVWLSSFFPSLEKKERKKLLTSSLFAPKRDRRLCLQAMNKKEEWEMLTLNACRVFELRLDWPIQSVFLQAVDENWDLIDFDTYRSLLNNIAGKAKKWAGVLYHELFLDLWRRSPDHLKEEVKDDPDLKKKIDSLFDSIREERRKSDQNKMRKKRKQNKMKRKQKQIGKKRKLSPVA